MSQSRGYTLIELLVVMAIVGTLAGLGLIGVPLWKRHAMKTATKTFISTLSAAIEVYRSNEGAYPPTSLRDFPGVGTTNDENSGIESVVLCLNSTQNRAPFDLAGSEGCTLENLDGDQSQAQLTRFGTTKALFEAVDPWDTPYVYFNAQDYIRAPELGKTSLRNGGTLKALPWHNAKLTTAFRPDSFQIISAGPDAIFNTEDDITNFVPE